MRTFAASEVGTCGGHNGDGVFALCPDRLPAAAGTAVLEVSFQEGDTRRATRCRAGPCLSTCTLLIAQPHSTAQQSLPEGKGGRYVRTQQEVAGLKTV